MKAFFGLITIILLASTVAFADSTHKKIDLTLEVETKAVLYYLRNEEVLDQAGLETIKKISIEGQLSRVVDHETKTIQDTLVLPRFKLALPLIRPSSLTKVYEGRSNWEIPSREIVLEKVQILQILKAVNFNNLASEAIINEANTIAEYANFILQVDSFDRHKRLADDFLMIVKKITATNSPYRTEKAVYQVNVNLRIHSFNFKQIYF